MWANGTAYEAYVGRWSRLVTKEFLAWLNVEPQRHWLDVGCGTGVLSQTILEYMPLTLKGLDSSEGFVAYAKNKITDARATFIVGDARALPFENQNFDTVVSGLMLNFVPEPEKAVTEMVRVTKLGGTVAAYVWDYAGKFQGENLQSLTAHDQKDFHPGMEMMRYFWDAVVTLNPQGLSLDEGQRYPLCHPKPLADLFGKAGLGQVEVRALDVPTYFRDFDDYWSPFLGGTGTAPNYVASLTEEARAALRDYLQEHLPIQSDGSLQLIARAWAVLGTKQA
jgi:SAM-dependent methyltransferase